MGTVMVVEDDFDILEVMEQVLRDEGYQVIGATNGEQALGHLRETRPDLILLDLRMPGMSGQEVRQRQLEEGLCIDVPLIVLSADADIGDIAAEMKGTGHLRKPVQLAELMAAVAQALARGDGGDGHGGNGG
jgi:two-component system, chemotaxis family, chemotaxis protein CheY